MFPAVSAERIAAIDSRLGALVEVGGRLVEQPHRRLGEEQPDQVGKRALAAGQAASAFGDRQVEPLGVGGDEILQADMLGLGDDLVVARMGRPMMIFSRRVPLSRRVSCAR